MWKKTFTSTLIIGTLLGGVGTYQVVHAAPPAAEEQPEIKDKKSEMKDTKRDGRLEKAAEKMGNYLQQSKEQLLQVASKEKLTAKDMVVGAVLSKKAKQPFAQIAEEKTTLGNWKAVAEKYQISLEDVKKEIHQIFPHLKKEDTLAKNPIAVIDTVAKYLGKEKQEIALSWKKQPVRPYGLFHAAILSKMSGKSLDEVLALKTKENTWKDVAVKLQLKEEKVNEERKSLWKVLHQQKKDQKETNEKVES